MRLWLAPPGLDTVPATPAERNPRLRSENPPPAGARLRLFCRDRTASADQPRTSSTDCREAGRRVGSPTSAKLPDCQTHCRQPTGSRTAVPRQAVGPAVRGGSPPDQVRNGLAREGNQVERFSVPAPFLPYHAERECVPGPTPANRLQFLPRQEPVWLARYPARPDAQETHGVCPRARKTPARRQEKAP